MLSYDGKQFYTMDVAQVAHGANRALRQVIGEAPGPPWDELDDETRESVRLGVLGIERGNTPEESHELWLDTKISLGWSYGEVQNNEKKEHPNLVEWSKLPHAQRAKDILFHGVVSAMIEANKGEV